MSYRKRIPKAVRTAVYNIYTKETGGKCYVGCGERISMSNFECGHIVAHSRGGKVTIQNLRPVCSSCNNSIGPRDMREFIKEYGFSDSPLFHKEID